MPEDDDWPGGCGGFWGVMAFFIIVAAVASIALGVAAVM